MSCRNWTRSLEAGPGAEAGLFCFGPFGWELDLSAAVLATMFMPVMNETPLPMTHAMAKSRKTRLMRALPGDSILTVLLT